MSCFDLEYIYNKYNINARGIIHIGAHTGEEKNLYDKLNIKNTTIWIEANPDLIISLKNNVKNDIVINEVISDKEETVKFYITKNLEDDNNKQSSSLKQLDYHLIAHPSVILDKEIIVNTITMNKLLSKYNIDITKYNFLNIDTQGNELEVLKGFGNILLKIDYIYTEINIKNLYKNIALLDEIDNFLNKFGFKRVDTSIHEEEGWGQGFYFRI